MGGFGDKLEGKADELRGKVKESVGDATDNPDLQAEGRGDRVEGKVEQAIGEAKEAWEDVQRDRGPDDPRSGLVASSNSARQRRASGRVRSSSIRTTPDPRRRTTRARPG